MWVIILPMNTVFWYRCVHLISYNQSNGAENETDETTLTLSSNLTLVFTDVQADTNALQVLFRLFVKVRKVGEITWLLRETSAFILEAPIPFQVVPLSFQTQHLMRFFFFF